MKKFLSIFLALSAGLLAEGEYGLNWANYDYMNQDDVTRSAVWNPATDHVLVSTRLGYPRIVILDAETGEYIGEMDTTGLSAPGTAEEGLGLLAISDDGYIYACNLGHDLYGWNFVVWRFDDENATAQVVFDEMVDTDVSTGYEWWGASLAVVGSGTDTYLFTSGWQNDVILVLKMGPRNYFEVYDTIQLPSWNSARHGISPVSAQGPFWINGAGDTTPPIRLIGWEGEIYAQVPDSMISAGGTSGVLHWQVGNIKVVTAINGFLNSTLRSVRYQEDELGTISFSYLGGNSDSLMLAYNGATLYMNLNCSGTMCYDPTRHAMYTVMGNNSVASVDLNPLINVRTPRNAGFLAVVIDGKNKEYTHYDYLGTSNERDLYATWDANTMYFGMSGHSLFEAYQSRGLYLVFDLDPDGENGSAASPDGVNLSYPFNADVVIRLDSDNAVNLGSNDPADKWTTGMVYKWNGNAWAENMIAGFDINYGAMAVIGDGMDSLMTEVGVALNPSGIGNDFTAVKFLAYLADQRADGSVYAVFPSVNDAKSAFTAWYEADSIGSGMLISRDVKVGGGPSAIQEKNGLSPNAFQLTAVYPNPFNPQTKIQYLIPEAAKVKVQIFDLNGKVVSTLINEYQAAGRYTQSWNATGFGSGIYLAALTVNGKITDSHKLVLLK